MWPLGNNEHECGEISKWAIGKQAVSNVGNTGLPQIARVPALPKGKGSLANSRVRGESSSLCWKPNPSTPSGCVTLSPGGTRKAPVNGSTKPFFILWVFATNPHLLALSCNPASEGHSQGRLRPQTVIGGYEDKEHSLRVGEKTWIKEAFFSMSGGGAAFTHSRAEPTEYLG